MKSLLSFEVFPVFEGEAETQCSVGTLVLELGRIGRRRKGMIRNEKKQARGLRHRRRSRGSPGIACSTDSFTVTQETRRVDQSGTGLLVVGVAVDGWEACLPEVECSGCELLGRQKIEDQTRPFAGSSSPLHKPADRSAH